MNQANVVFRYNERPNRGLALLGLLLFLKGILLIPHLIVVGVLNWLAGIVAWIGYWIVAFTGKLPDGLADLMGMYLRWQTRTQGWFMGITDQYPPFESDPAGYRFDAEMPTNENPSRGLAVAGILFMLKALALIPHFIVVLFLWIAAAAATWAGYLIVLITGSLPYGLQDFLAGVQQWWIRIAAWLYGLTDEYPPFSLQVTATTAA
jgi:hypothetical protein